MLKNPTQFNILWIIQKYINDYTMVECFLLQSIIVVREHILREQSLDLINSIQANLYKTWNIDKNGYYLPYYGANTPDMSRWYPDAQSQLFPLLFWAIHSGSHCFVYDNFKKNFPDWIDSKHADGRFPSSFIAKVAFMCNDYESLRLFLINTKQEFGNNGNKWPWNINEAWWLIDVSKVCEKNSSCKRVVER